MAKNLNSVDGVIDALGGIKRVARLTRCGATAVHNWRKRGCFPARFYVKMTKRLSDCDCVARPSLWGQEVSRLDLAA